MGKNGSDLNRRRFLEGAAAALGIAALGRMGHSETADPPQPASANIPDSTAEAEAHSHILNYQPGISYRQFGKTDMYFSVLGLGSVTCVERAIRRGIERGLNFVHTSEHYEGGQAIQKVGRIMKNHRDKVYLAIKANFRSLEGALKKLNTDYVDLVMFDRHDPRAASDSSLRDRFEKWKEEGKARYMGLTTHGHVKECVQVALESGMYSAVMPTYNVKSEAEIGDEIKACEEKGLPIFAMKTMGGIREEDQGQRLRTVLSSPAVAVLIKGMSNMEMLDRLIEAQTPERLGSADPFPPGRLRATPCMMCSRCEDTCPNHLAIPDMIRCSRYYHDELGTDAHARATFAEIPHHRTAHNCADCGSCEKVCPLGLKVRAEIRRATGMFG